MKVLFIDNFDSFTFNLVDDLRLRGAEVEVWRNDIDADFAMDRIQSWKGTRLILLSPGPGTPESAGCCLELIRKARGVVPVFGVCLGHQSIVEALGGTVGPAGEVVHGKAALIDHAEAGLFEGIPNPMRVARYHSLTALKVPEQLAVTARLGDLVMAVEDKECAVAGVQFHPESLLTPDGGALFENLFQWAEKNQ
ncbi:MAG: aminodeoxychorismate/anthranilate synthase component II [Planctomycetota bacterium]|nr:aminodeoxychorismate/anthranilate synthase component II [Planctomycetota bacterium]